MATISMAVSSSNTAVCRCPEVTSPTYLDIEDITLPIRTELSEYLSPTTKACGNNEHEEDSVDRGVSDSVSA